MDNYEKIGSLKEFPDKTIKCINLNDKKIAVFNFDGVISAIENECRHKQGPLAEGIIRTIDKEKYVACPWHGWEYSIKTGRSPPGYSDAVDQYEVKIENEKVYVSIKPVQEGAKKRIMHEKAKKFDKDSKLYNPSHNHTFHVLGISTTAMDNNLPRISTSEQALKYSLNYAKTKYNAEIKQINLRDLNFNDCEGNYSKDKRACTFPCAITERDSNDQLIEVYDALISWADIVLVATPIRWGNASSLYYKMAHRMNTIQNQITIANRYLIRFKTAGFIVTGGQDNIQHVVGEMLTFWSELGFVFGQFPFAGWSRGWFNENMPENIQDSTNSEDFKEELTRLVDNAIIMHNLLKNAGKDYLHQELPLRSYGKNF